MSDLGLSMFYTSEPGSLLAAMRERGEGAARGVEGSRLLKFPRVAESSSRSLPRGKRATRAPVSAPA